MRRKDGPRMLAKARGKYGKPNYPGRVVKEKVSGKNKIEDVCVVAAKGNTNNLDENTQKIWNSIKKVAYKEVSPVSYETWIEPCNPVIIADGRIVLMVENGFYKYMLEKRYVAFLQKIAEKVMNQDKVTIEIVIPQQ